KQLFAISLTPALVVLSACGQTGPLYGPDEDKLNSGSTLAKSGSSIMVKQKQQNNSTSTSVNQRDTSTKVDNDATAPVRNN
ncbi:lipoprotein, partial [Francisella tularensis subsp. holarctica]|uniref:LPS translocon maturation chaperone LptM n=1 Tax=Francisella tularensis TaxID=263 RepID=UPI002381A699